MILMVAVLLLTLLFSRGFCGWICPFGSVQEWLGLLGRKIFRKTYNPTGAWDRGLRYRKYAINVAAHAASVIAMLSSITGYQSSFMPT
jgi:polyferredoxin